MDSLKDLLCMSSIPFDSISPSFPPPSAFTRIYMYSFFIIPIISATPLIISLFFYHMPYCQTSIHCYRYRNCRFTPHFHIGISLLKCIGQHFSIVEDSMPRLVPAEYHFIPVSAVTEGHDVQRLAIEKHIFPALKPARQRIAFLWSHSNGFHKESLHPVMRRFLSNLRSKSGLDDVDVHFIAWDARNHGDSARLNEGTFKETCK